MMRGCLFSMVMLVGGCTAATKMPWAPPSPCPETPTTVKVVKNTHPTPDVVTIGGRGGSLRPLSATGEYHWQGDTAAAFQGPVVLPLRWPLPATGVSSLYGPRKDPLDGTERFHYGVDLQGVYGTRVQAIAGGTIVVAGWHRGHGRMVAMVHAGGYESMYSHLAQVTVVEGQYIRGGQVIGLLGNSGRSTGPHLHFELRRHGTHIDPLDVLGTSVPLD